jgi:ribonuclease HI
MRFKEQAVWVNADDDGRPILDGTGRAEMKYRETDSKTYRPLPVNLSPETDGAPPAPAPAPRRARRIEKAPPAPRRATSGSAIEVWTDGACSGNPGPMGIGIVVVDRASSERKEHGEYLGIGTNNIAELTAIGRGLEIAGGIVKKEDAAHAAHRPIKVFTDSAYSIGVLSKGWKAKANQELVAQLRRQLAALPDVEMVKVAGHAGVPENERCDELATEAAARRR